MMRTQRDNWTTEATFSKIMVWGHDQFAHDSPIVRLQELVDMNDIVSFVVRNKGKLDWQREDEFDRIAW